MYDDPRTSSDGTDATEAARQEKEQVKGTVKDAASNVQDEAKRHGQALKQDAREHARSITRDTRGQLRRHGEEETQRAGAALSTAGTQLRALADGRVDEAGVLADYVGTAADYVNRWADSIQDRGMDGLLDDLRSFGRRRPGMFLAGAVVAGLVAGRFGRNATRVLGDDDEGLSEKADRALPSGSDDGRSLTDKAKDAVTSDDDDRDHDRDDAAYTPAGGLVDTDHDGDRDRAATDDDLIVGHATDDSGVVIEDADRGAFGDDGSSVGDDRGSFNSDEIEYRPIDVDRGRT